MFAKIGLLAIFLFLVILCACGGSPRTSAVVPPATATATRIYVESEPPYGSNDYYHGNPVFTIDIDLKPGSLAEADTAYAVVLNENGSYRSDTQISWTQAQLNISAEQTVKFPCTEHEYVSYYNQDISQMFSVDITLSTASPIPTTALPSTAAGGSGMD